MTAAWTILTVADFAKKITGVVLAGGQGSRMGGVDKGLVRIAGRPMIEHVISRLKPQVGTLLINANRNLDAYRELGYPVVPDASAEYLGPLAGFLAAMRAAETPFILTTPCDTPLLPRDLAARLWREFDDPAIGLAVVSNGSYLEPVFALIATSLADSLEVFLNAGGRKIDRWYATTRMATVDFSDAAESFANVNDPEQSSAMEARLRGEPEN